MRCPLCEVDLIRTERLGVRAGYCPECEGEWFARGAVDALLDRAGRGGNGREPRLDAPGGGGSGGSRAPAVRTTS